jgi:hypothetical protein
MSGAEIQGFLRSFEAYVNGFLSGEPGADRNIELKREHSRKVLDEAAMIADDEGLTGRLARLARLAALLHDFGRFRQFAEYGTFIDKNSVNHGLLGCRELRASGFLQGLPEADRHLVRCVTAVHNRRFLPAGLPEDAGCLARLVRDADKLDIYRVMLEHFRPDGTVNHVVTLSKIDEPGAYSASVYEQARRGQADYDEMVYVNDFKLLLLSWAHDLGFAATRRAFAERGYLDRLLETLPRDRRIGRLGEELRQALAA